jgi:hypothetical protein
MIELTEVLAILVIGIIWPVLMAIAAALIALKYILIYVVMPALLICGFCLFITGSSIYLRERYNRLFGR